MYQDHRKLLLELLAEVNSVGIFPAGSLVTRNADCDYRFRPNSDFWYLTGFAEPDSILVLLPDGDERAVMFLPELNKSEEIWNGKRLGTAAAPAELGVDCAYPIEEFWTKLPELLAGHTRVIYSTGSDKQRDSQLLQTVDDLRRKSRGGVVAPMEWLDPAPFLHELRLKKSAAESDAMRKAAAITTTAHLAAMAATEPGKNEAEIDALIDFEFRRRGSSGQAYNNIVAGGDNACTLHYILNNEELKDGDLLLIDAGCEWEYYASDVTRTFPINGTFSAEQRAVYELVLKSQKAGIAQAVPGNSFLSVHEVTLKVLVEGMIELGWLSGTFEENLKSEDYKRFFMHKTGHWLGLDVHDCGTYYIDGESRLLEPGMVTTVEPGLYVAANEETVEARWRGIGIRIEDDILITAGGNENLTAAIPKEIDDV
ncbi:MAG: Xaa-Pro aminopeptidase, partial [Planctomycetota bacterium]